MKKIVWDLFGGLNGSVGSAIGYDKYEIYTFDILPKTKDGRDNIVIDLAMEDTDKLLQLMSKYPKPDIIVSSPICSSFSIATAMKGGNASWKFGLNDKLYYRKPTDYVNVRFNYNTQLNKAKQGAYSIKNTIKLIIKYKPTYWYIENPQTSLIWRYINNNLLFNKGFKNLTYYGLYGFEAKKPTIFMSNLKLNLKLNDKYSKHKSFQSHKHLNRSDIPKSLIQEIFKQFEKPQPQQLELF